MNKPECKIYPDGIKEWWLNGKRHREDGPAWENLDGSKLWYLNGRLHREDGPACEYPNGTKEWWLNGNNIHPEVLVDLWLEREVFCWWDETTQTLNFAENNE
jgi:hypothetical protein